MTDHTHHMPPADDIYPQDTTGPLEAATARPRDADVLPLCIGPVRRQIAGHQVGMLAYNASIPGPLLRVSQGTEVTVDVGLDQTVQPRRRDAVHRRRSPLGQTALVRRARLPYRRARAGQRPAGDAGHTNIKEEGTVMYERAILRIGAVSLSAGLIAAVVFEALHPAREDPNNNPRVFVEYAADADWTTVHLGALAGALLLIGGLVALSSSLNLGPEVSAAWARLAGAAAVTAAAAYGVLQVVDGVALKRAVDGWVAAPAEEKTATFAAAQAVRWTEYGLNALTYSMVGLTLMLIAVALIFGDRFPRWLGGWAIAAGLAYIVKGIGVAYSGFAASLSGLVALALFGTWVITMAVLMWRRSSRTAGYTTGNDHHASQHSQQSLVG